EGLVHDLALALEFWRSKGRIETFELGEADVACQFTVPANLYGREQESLLLYKCCGRAIHGTNEVVSISGPAGIGKSALVNELQKILVLSHGIFLEGRLAFRVECQLVNPQGRQVTAVIGEGLLFVVAWWVLRC
ncbi:hypothetical protein E3A20_28340, partial [Planctomyces bekefii]